MTRIMIVEGERTVSEDIQRSLQYLGYTVSAVVSSGKEAVAKANENPDLVLMDTVLKGDMDSITAAEYIRSQFGIPVVYMTTDADKPLLERAAVAEPYGYVVKPTEYRELHMAIEMALHKHYMEKKVKDSEQWLVTTLKSIGDGVITTDTRGTITYMNPAAEILTGWTHKEAAGKSLEEVFYLINGKTRQHCENVLEKIMTTGGVIGFTSNTVLLSKEGTERLLIESGAPIRDETNRILGSVVVFRDVTEKRKMEKDLIQLRMEKIESISVLAGGIAHDFNNILTAILGNITLAKLHTTPEDEVFTILTEAEKASVRAKHLTQQLLTFSKDGAPVKQPALIGELIKDTARFALSSSQVQCTFCIPDDLWAVDVDAGQISQVIDNVVINADQAMPDKGVITVKAENVTNANALPGRYVKVSITDEGAGIPEEYLPHIFEPYFTTKQKGSGLGLATAHSIIKNHDGYMTVDSAVGEGTTFCIFLPACEKEVVPEQKKVITPTKGGGRVLLTDDEECILKATGDTLMHLGYEVVFAKKGEKAVKLYKKAKENKKPFDVVIVDLNVSGKINGKETMKNLLAVDPSVKALVSGYADDPVMKDYKDYGFKGAVTKPYTMGELSEILQRVVSNKC